MSIKKKVGFDLLDTKGVVGEQVLSKLQRKSVLTPEDAEEEMDIQKNKHMVQQGKNKIFKKGMTLGAMREALRGFVKKKKFNSDGENIKYQKILDRVERIVESDVQLTAQEMVKLQLRIVTNE